MKTEVLTLNKERNVTLTTYIQDCGEGFGCVAKRPAVLILPGGAYQMCSDRELILLPLLLQKPDITLSFCATLLWTIVHGQIHSMITSRQ